jgi:TonB-linked SusC/RagA family outer membrane protein
MSMKQFLFSFLVLLMSTSLTLAQRTVSGKVTDAAGESVIGASVFVKEAPGVGTITDIDGMYQLNVPASGNTLVFSYTGFETIEVPITGGAINVTMQEGKLLDEVVVTGYGTQIKSRLTGNIAKVSGKDLADAPVVSLDQAMQGRAAGVFIEQNNGKVGGASRMRIRGSSSINASSQPLFVIDGIPISTENMNGLGSNTNPLAALNPNDIESIEVLKDASAAAIYGSRGANGVVIVTTKKGSKGASIIDFNVQYGSSNPTNLREFMNGEEFISFFREAAANSDAYENDNFWVGFNEGRLARYAGHAGERVDGVFQWTDSPQNTDWQREAFKRANSMQANISARGGTDKLQYFTSAAYNNQDGIIVGNNFKRYTGRLNLKSQLNDWIDLGMNMNLSRNYIDQVTGDNAFNTPIQLSALSPITPIRDRNGRLYDTPTTTYYNGLIDVEDSKREITETRTLANIDLGFKLAEGLKWNNELGFDLTNLKENGFFGSRTLGGRATNGNGFAAYAENQNIIGKSFLSYDKTFNSLTMNAVLGTEAQKNTNR